MKGPYGLETIEDCQNCNVRGSEFFCQLSAGARSDLDAIRFNSSYPRDAVLFMEKQMSRGVYVLCEGEVKLSISSVEGKKMILRIAKAGEVLGLMSVLSGTAYEVTAETLRPAQVTFIRREAFLSFMAKHPEAYPAVARQLGMHYQVACEQLRTVGLSASAQERLAKLLLELSVEGQETDQGTRVKLPLTHEEIAEFIGTTRETVTRTLTEFKNQKLLTITGSTLLIQDLCALRTLAAA